jgi:hypothetical protein
LKRVIPALIVFLSTAACHDSNVPSLEGRTPAIPTPLQTALGAVSGQIEFVIEAQLTHSGDSGTFLMTGAIRDSGITISREGVEGERLVIERELRGDLGTIFIHMEGPARADGRPTDLRWSISGATRGYEGLTGGGAGFDEFTSLTFRRGQFTGIIEK